jgi:hypothetical protein
MILHKWDAPEGFLFGFYCKFLLLLQCLKLILNFLVKLGEAIAHLSAMFPAQPLISGELRVKRKHKTSKRTNEHIIL